MAHIVTINRPEVVAMIEETAQKLTGGNKTAVVGLGRPGLASAPLTCLAAASSYQLDPLEHRDPADRRLIATAIDLACPLITYDARILNFAQAHGREYAFMIA